MYVIDVPPSLTNWGFKHTTTSRKRKGKSNKIFAYMKIIFYIQWILLLNILKIGLDTSYNENCLSSLLHLNHVQNCILQKINTLSPFFPDNLATNLFVF
jgi:hypothetical protein